MWSDLQEQLGRPVFEVPTLPPSVPGMRVSETLRDALRERGGRIVLNSEAVARERATARASRRSARPPRGARSTTARAGSCSPPAAWRRGGIALDSHWRARETALGLPVHGVPAPGEPRFGADYFGEQPFARAGVAVDDGLRPVDGDGRRLLDNVLVAGATLAGAAALAREVGRRHQPGERAPQRPS